MKDRRIFLKAVGVWWLVSFVSLVIIPELFYAMAAGSDMFEFLKRTFIVCGICAVVAVPTSLFLVLVVFRRLNKQLPIYIRLMTECKRDGFTDKLVAEMKQQYDFCAANMSFYSSYYNGYAVILASYYSDLGETEAALAYIDSVDMTQMRSEPKMISSKVRLLNYYAVKLVIECEAKERARADATYMEAIDIFGKYAAEVKAEMYVEYACSGYDCLCGRYELAEARLKRLVETEPMLRFSVTEALAECYLMQGCLDKAEGQLKEALSVAGNKHEFTVLKRLEEKIEEAGRDNVGIDF